MKQTKVRYRDLPTLINHNVNYNIVELSSILGRKPRALLWWLRYMLGYPSEQKEWNGRELSNAINAYYQKRYDPRNTDEPKDVDRMSLADETGCFYSTTDETLQLSRGLYTIREHYPRSQGKTIENMYQLLILMHDVMEQRDKLDTNK